jgi:hypothetical protein
MMQPNLKMHNKINYTRGCPKSQITRHSREKGNLLNNSIVANLEIPSQAEDDEIETFGQPLF